jgi:hypothetical protein
MSQYDDRLDADIERADRKIRETGERVAAQVRKHGPVTGRAVAPNGSITVVAGPGGRLVELRIEHTALNQRPEQLAAELVRLAGIATREANARAHRAVSPVVGPAVTESLSELGIRPGAADEDGGGLDFLGRPC